MTIEHVEDGIDVHGTPWPAAPKPGIFKTLITTLLLKLLPAKSARRVAVYSRVFATVKAAKDDMSETSFDFYRCEGCRSLLTRLREISAMDPDDERVGTVCKCGSMRYRPSWPRPYEWVYPKVVWFTLLRWLGVA